ncbi:unnamed protein product [Didymodactylos carnosus]|uniref:F-box domain-containing protein n=1 Tax=Didymodactylos carnosus TaxID=1234261 RepID=A0A815RLT7_9BILA|nr:unnamed protein product [Didymodactylos carnosus]CAF4342783.1 unnamed protein product [Didymodactylos carnosus]
MPSLLEQLPNEIVLDILQYLKSLDLFESFNDLNWRFNQLLSVLMLSVNISEALSKHLFDDYCINVIPKCLTQTVSLKISDRFGRLTQFHKLFQLDMFMNIRSLILQNPTHDNLKLIMKKLSKLIHIEQLQIASYGPNKLDLNSCSKTMTEVIFQKKTTLKRVTLSFYSSIILDQTTIQTCNIEYLNMYGCYIDEFVTLLKHLPKIKRVDIHVYNSQNSDDTTDYKIYQNIGQYVPNLTYVEIHVSHIEFDKTEQLLKSIPQLKILVFSGEYLKMQICMKIYLKKAQNCKNRHILKGTPPLFLGFP